MVLARMRASYKSIQPLDPVCKPMRHKKIKCAIGNWWLGCVPFAAKNIKNIIGPKRLVLRQKNLENPLADRGQLNAFLGADVTRCCDCRSNASRMVVALETRRFDNASLLWFDLDVL